MVLNSEWAVCAGLTVKQVNQLEKQFLHAIVSVLAVFFPYNYRIFTSHYLIFVMFLELGNLYC